MSEQLTPISSLANSSMTILVGTVNAIINTMATDMVTANGSANGGLTIGNGYVSGIFGASILTSGSIRGGNVQSSANLVVSSNVVVNSSSVIVLGSAQVNSINLTIPTVSVTNAVIGYFPQSNLSFANSSLYEVDLTTSGVSGVVLDSFPLGVYRTAEYLLQATDNAANNHQSSRLLVTHNGNTAISTEYAQLVTNTAVATFSVSTNATSLILTVTPATTNSTIRALRTSLNS